jgi:hypothetical protein
MLKMKIAWKLELNSDLTLQITVGAEEEESGAASKSLLNQMIARINMSIGAWWFW